MAVVVRYFSVAAAGAGDGTTWADRAALFNAGNWSTVITGFNFAQSDSLECRIGPGTYACGQSLANPLFANQPSPTNPLILVGCDATGAALAPPDPDWSSAAPPWDDSSLPLISAAAGAIGAVSALVCWTLRFACAAQNGTPFMGVGVHFNWCKVENTTSNTSVRAAASPVASNCVFVCSGTSFDAVVDFSGLSQLFNCRLIGNSVASAGARVGIRPASFSAATGIGVTVIGCAGGAVASSSTQVSQSFRLVSSTLVANPGSGVLGHTTAAQTALQPVTRCVIVGNGGHGVRAEGSRMVVSGCRLRNNTSGNFDGLGSYPSDLNNDVSAGTDADEFVDASAGDYRIKATSALWGKGYGAGDEIPTPASIAAAVWARSGRTLT